MTDKLTPGMLRDLADIIDAIPSGEYGAPHFREEAARREVKQPAAPAPADDLVERLRGGTGDGLRAWDWMREAADRIERETARADRLASALKSIAGNTCCTPCREAGLVAARALIEGGKPNG